MVRRSAIAILLALPWASASAQVTLRGRVLDRSTGQPLPGAEIVFPAQLRSVRTDDMGRYAVMGVPWGRIRIVARRIGYAAEDVLASLPSHGSMEWDFSLHPVAQILPALTVTGQPRAPTRAAMGGFEERRRWTPGRFLDRAQLAEMEHQTLPEVLRSIGVPVHSRGQGGDPRTRSWAAYGRGFTSLNPEEPMCFMQVIVDGVRMSNPPRTARVEVDRIFDLEGIPVRFIEAIEFYRGPAQVPLEFEWENAACGVLVIWTRVGREP